MSWGLRTRLFRASLRGFDNIGQQHRASHRAHTTGHRGDEACDILDIRCDVADEAGVTANVAQQFEFGRQILANGLVPIIEPEVDINSPQKQEAEAVLKAAILRHLEAQPADQPVMLKLMTRPPVSDCAENPLAGFTPDELLTARN